ncbi:unnamed protein product [Lathyrus oleraceus]
MLTNEEGAWIKDVEQLHAMVNDYYKDIFVERRIMRNWWQTDVTFPELDRETKGRLAAPISNEEVRKATFNMNPGKEPGPDGFPAGFYQKSRGIVGSTVCEFAKQV